MIDYTRYSLQDIPLEQLALSVRPNNILKRAGLVSVLDVCRSINDGSISHVKNIGVKSVAEIIEKTEYFLTSYNLTLAKISDIPARIETSQSIDGSGSPNLPDNKPISDFPLVILNNYLGVETTNSLVSVGIEKIQDFHELVERYLTFINPIGDLINKTATELSIRVKSLVTDGQLSEKCVVDSKTLSELIDWQPADENDVFYKIQLLKQIIEEKSLSYQMISLMSGLSDRQKETFLDNSLRNMTLEAIGAKQGVTRERIRQIAHEVAKKLRNSLEGNPNVYISTSFEIAKELGSSLSRDSWKDELIQRQILTDKDRDYESFDFFIALLKNKFTTQSILGIPENVQLILRSESSHPIFVISAINSDIRKEFREIKDIIKFTGGISVEEAQQILGCDSTETSDLLRVIELQEVVPGWFTSLAKKDLSKNTPLLRAGLIMTQACGPLPFESFYEGLRRYISRRYDEIAPPEVIRFFIENLDFKVDTGMVSYHGNDHAEISESESLILNLLSERGPVLNFQEIVEFFLTKGKSFSTATTKIMPRSPIIEKVEHSLYKLRGSEVSPQDIETAKSRQEENAKNPEVIYGTDGIIRYRLTLGSWATGGVLSISRSVRPLPDFREGWPVFVDDEEVGTARRDDYLIWGLTAALNKLGANMGDRVELAFDIFNGPRINLRIVGETND